jgi:hypothetical protein
VSIDQASLPIGQAAGATGGTSTINAAPIAHGNSQSNPGIGMSDMNGDARFRDGFERAATANGAP